MRTKTEYNKIVNVERNEKNQVTEIKVLQEAFSNDWGFSGLTGSVFEPLSQEYADQIMEEFSDAENISESEEEILKLFGGFDDSFWSLWRYFYKELNIDPKEFPYFSCTGCGRCFKAGDTFNYAPELEYLLKKYEN